MDFYQYINFIRHNHLNFSKIRQREKHDITLDSCFVLFESSLVFDNGYFYNLIKKFFAEELMAENIKLRNEGFCGIERVGPKTFFDKYGFPANRLKDVNHFKLYMKMQQDPCLLYNLVRIQRTRGYDEFIETVLANSIKFGIDYRD